MISATKVRKQGKESGMRWLANLQKHTHTHTDVCTTHAHMMFAVAIVNE